MNKKQNDIESLKELLYTYEKTMEHKDNIIANMTKAIQKQVNIVQSMVKSIAVQNMARISKFSLSFKF